MNELYLEDFDLQLEPGQTILRLLERCPHCGRQYAVIYNIIDEAPKRLVGKCYKCAFKLNVNSPIIRELYDRYKKWKGLPPHIPLTDEQRHEFEEYVLKAKK